MRRSWPMGARLCSRFLSRYLKRVKAGGPDQPVAFTQSYGKGRIFQTLLGADAAAIGIPGTTQLIRYGSLWAAEK